MVLLDIMLPKVDGFEVLRRMKAEPAWRDIPVIIISALSDIESAVNGIKLGAEDFLPKPFNPTLLKARINAGLATKRLRDLEKEYVKTLEREMEIGHRIQADFLPQALPDLQGWDIAAYFQPAREVAGDFYDVFRLPDNHLGFFLGDVTDKGVGAALFMALYRSLLRAFMNAGNYLGIAGGAFDPGSLLLDTVNHTNRYVCQNHENALFATLFIGVLNRNTGQLWYVNAGQTSPKLINRQMVVQTLRPCCAGLGMSLEADYQVKTGNLASGDTLFMTSDGVEDTPDVTGSFFGPARLKEVITLPASTASEMVDHITHRLAAFRGDENQFDDVTMLIIRRVG